ncbi:MAG: aminobenzoyl-glutamate transport protein [Bermanella sp.]|jgi:aminobenzoyl-glutamate transport protein
MLGSFLGWQAQHPASGELLLVNSLASSEGLIYMLSHMVSNFMNFAPVGPVLMIALAFSLAEKSGLLPALISNLGRNTPSTALPLVIAFLGVMSSIAVDSGYVVLLPLCAALFFSSGRHPLAGLALGFACVSGGFSANLLVGPVDAMLSGITTEAIQLVADEEVTILGNYYFMLASVVLIVGITVSVNYYWIEPYLEASSVQTKPEDSHIKAEFGKAFYITLGLIILAWLILTVPDHAILRGPNDSLVKGPFMNSLVAMIALSVGALATVYGISNGRLNGWNKWVKAFEQGIVDITPYLALMFVVAQFIAWFKWSALGPVLAVHLASVLQDLSLSGPVAMIALMLFTAVLNLFIGSASAKWALLAPVLVPALYLLGIQPEAVQGAYRVADSSTNIITPLMPYFPLVLAYAQKYEPDVGVGRILTLMLPYSLSLLLGWGILLTVWMVFELPFGPG